MPPFIIAHRGLHNQYPENTLESFEAAIQSNVDGIECDVQITRDGHVVVFHDSTLERMGHSQKFIQELTIEQVREVDIVHPQSNKKAKIPTLLEVCDFIKDQCLFNIELKNYSFFDHCLEKAVLQILNTFKIESHILISSFNPISLRYFYKHAPHIERALLFYERQSWHNRRALFAPWAKVTTLNPSTCLATKQSIDRFHKKGYKIIVWTINSMDEARFFAKQNVHGLITDYPDLLIKLFKNT